MRSNKYIVIHILAHDCCLPRHSYVCFVVLQKTVVLISSFRLTSQVAQAIANLAKLVNNKDLYGESRWNDCFCSLRKWKDLNKNRLTSLKLRVSLSFPVRFPSRFLVILCILIQLACSLYKPFFVDRTIKCVKWPLIYLVHLKRSNIVGLE